MAGARSLPAEVTVRVEPTGPLTGCRFERENHHLSFHHPALYSPLLQTLLDLPTLQGRVTVLRAGHPVEGASVTVRASQPAFPGASGLPELSEVSAGAGADGVASFELNPPKPNPTDTIQLTGSVAIDGVEHSCQGTLVVGLGVQLLPYVDALDDLASSLAVVGRDNDVDQPAFPAVRQSRSERIARLHRAPFVFEENRGQAAESADFVALVGGDRLLIGASGVGLAGRSGQTMEIVGADPEAEGAAADLLPGRSHYLFGGKAEDWLTNIPQASEVRYRAIYPGVDVVYYGNDRRLEYDFVVAPGADPDQIRLRFPALPTPRNGEDGDLLTGDDAFALRLKRPVAYQTLERGRVEIAADYRIDDSGAARIELGPWDPAEELVIDPILEFSSYLGGALDDSVSDLTTDADGNLYITGSTASQGLATSGVLQGSSQPGGLLGSDAFVAKLDPTGSNLLYLTYIGGSNEDSGFGIALDGDGNVLIAGTTMSADFPTVAAHQSQIAGPGSVLGSDSFVSKLSPDGSALVYSTYLGGTGLELGGAIDVDRDGNAFLVASTTSTDLPTVNPFQAEPGSTEGFAPDGMVAKLDPSGRASFVSYLGGSAEDWGFAVAADGAGNAWITGMTHSDDFPLAGRPLQGGKRGASDGFLARVHSAGRTLLYSSYIGGTNDDSGRDVDVDSGGNVYLTGSTGSPDFPVSDDGTADLAEEGVRGQDVFVAKFEPNATEIEYSAFLGGSGTDLAQSIFVDVEGRAVVAGESDSTDLESLRPFQDTNGGLYDAFVFKLDQAGSPEYATYVGGSGNDGASGVALGADGRAVVAGTAVSADFPTTAGARQPAAAGRTESFLAKIVPSGPIPRLTTEGIVSAADFSGEPLATDSWVALFGENLAKELVLASGALPTRLGGTSVAVVDRFGRWRPAKLQFVSPNRLNFLMPRRALTGEATVEVTNDGGQVGRATVVLTRVAPSLFTADSTGGGPAAATFLRVTAAGERAEGFTFDPNDASRPNVPIDLGAVGDEVYVSFFGTGFRSQRSFSAMINGVVVAAVGAVAQGQFEGLDQAVVGPLPRDLIGAGEVNAVLTFDGQDANTVTLSFQ